MVTHDSYLFMCTSRRGNARSLKWRVWSFEWERVKKMEGGKIPGSLAQGLGETEILTPKMKIQEEEGFRFRLVEL